MWRGLFGGEEERECSLGEIEGAFAVARWSVSDCTSAEIAKPNWGYQHTHTLPA